MSFLELVRILRGRFWIVLLVWTAIAGGAAAWLAQQPRVYGGEAEVLVDLQRPDPLHGNRIDRMLRNGYLRTQMDLIRSPATAAAVVAELRLDEGAQVRSRFLEATGGRGTVREWVAELLLRNLFVTPRERSSVLVVSFFSQSPEAAATIATAFARAYVERNAALRAEPARRAAEWLAADAEARRSALAQSESALATTQARLGLTALAAELDAETRRLEDLTRLHSTALSRAADRSARAALARSFAERGQPLGSLPDVLADAGIGQLQKSLARLAGELQAEGERLGPHHPLQVARVERFAELDLRLRAAIATAADAIEREAANARGAADELARAVERQRGVVLSMQGKRAQAAVAAAEARSDGIAFAESDRRRSEALIEGGLEQGNAFLLAAALQPTRAASPRVARTLAIALVVGLLAGVAAALHVEMFRQRVRAVHALPRDADALTLRMPRARLRTRAA